MKCIDKSKSALKANTGNYIFDIFTWVTPRCIQSKYLKWNTSSYFQNSPSLHICLTSELGIITHWVTQAEKLKDILSSSLSLICNIRFISIAFGFSFKISWICPFLSILKASHTVWKIMILPRSLE